MRSFKVLCMAGYDRDRHAKGTFNRRAAGDDRRAVWTHQDWQSSFIESGRQCVTGPGHWLDDLGAIDLEMAQLPRSGGPYAWRAGDEGALSLHPPSNLYGSVPVRMGRCADAFVSAEPRTRGGLTGRRIHTYAVRGASAGAGVSGISRLRESYEANDTVRVLDYADGGGKQTLCVSTKCGVEQSLPQRLGSTGLIITFNAVPVPADWECEASAVVCSTTICPIA